MLFNFEHLLHMQQWYKLVVSCSSEHWNWDTWTGEEREEDYGEEVYDDEDYNPSEPHCEDEGFVVS